MITRDKYMGPVTKSAEAMFARADRLAARKDFGDRARPRTVRATAPSLIRQVLHELGLTITTLRLWEDAGIVGFERQRGQRLADEAGLERLRMVVRLRRKGFSVREIAWISEVLPPTVEAMQAALADRTDQFGRLHLSRPAQPGR